MRRSPGQALCLGIDHDSLALVRTGGVFGGRTAVLAEARIDDARLAPELARGLSELRDELRRASQGDHRLAGWPLRVVVADELARLWPVAPPPAAATPADLEAAAALRYQALFGAPPSGWRIAADWRAGQPFLAAALPESLLDAVLGWAGEAGCHAVEIVPQLVAAMNGWRRQRRAGAWFGLVHNGVLGIAIHEGARLAALNSAVVPPGAGREWLDNLVAREALRVGVPLPPQFQLGGPAPRAWFSQEGSLEFACMPLGGGEDNGPLAGASSAVRLACTGSAA